MRAKEFSVIEGAGGLDYEQRVATVLKQVLPQFSGQAKFVSLDCGTAGYCNVGIDLELIVNGNEFNVEIKQSKKAQMGGTSVRYDPTSDRAEIVSGEGIDDEVKPFFISAAKTKKDSIIKFVDFIKTQPPLELHANMSYKFPVAGVTKDSWEKAKNAGLLKSLNDQVRFTNSKIIANAYNRKNVYYIQIGGAGLFYLNKNPYNLPVPAFDGEIDIEFRLGRSGSKPRLVNGKTVSVVSATYRCQGRLITQIKSDLSLDDPKDAATILSHIINFNQKRAEPAKIPPGIANQNTKLAASKIPMASTT